MSRHHDRPRRDDRGYGRRDEHETHSRDRRRSPPRSRRDRFSRSRSDSLDRRNSRDTSSRDYYSRDHRKSPVRVKRERDSLSPPKSVAREFRDRERHDSYNRHRRVSPVRVKREQHSRSPSTERQRGRPDNQCRDKGTLEPVKNDDAYPRPKFEPFSELKEDPTFPQKEEPNFELSGLLAEEQNHLNGVALTFTLSLDSALPLSDNWRLYEFDTDDNTNTIKLFKNACFLFGHDPRLSDDSNSEIKFINLTDDTVSKQHAVIQFRKRSNDVLPYLMDLNSTNHTFLNESVIDAGKYIELRHQDVIQFGKSDREYVLLNALS